MRTILICLLLAYIPVTLFAQTPVAVKNGTVVIVRHAEKGKGGNDPGLTEAGVQRSSDLLAYLSKNRIRVSQVYVSPYKRTKETAGNVISEWGPAVIQYKADVTGKGLREEVEKNFKERTNILIVGHSNTVPSILKQFGISSYPNDIPDAEHDNIFIIKFRKGKGRLVHGRYGVPSVASK